jgi:phage terminase small subunit
MARPRTPTSVLELKGSFKNHPERKRPHEPKPEGELGPAPEHLTDQERATWEEVVRITPARVLTSADRLIVEVTSRLMTKYRADPTFTAAELSKLISCLARLGLTPSDRSKVAVVPEKKPNTFSKWEL